MWRNEKHRMSNDELSGEKTEAPLQRVNITLSIDHPLLDPAEITSRLGLEAHFSHKSGERIVTPAGLVMPGRYFDTRWRHVILYEYEDQFFAKEVVDFVKALLPHKVFLREVRETGGSASIILGFLGDGYHGDRIGFDTLSNMNELQLDLCLDVYNVRQN